MPERAPYNVDYTTTGMGTMTIRLRSIKFSLPSLYPLCHSRDKIFQALYRFSVLESWAGPGNEATFSVKMTVTIHVLHTVLSAPYYMESESFTNTSPIELSPWQKLDVTNQDMVNVPTCALRRSHLLSYLDSIYQARLGFPSPECLFQPFDLHVVE